MASFCERIFAANWNNDFSKHLKLILRMWRTPVFEDRLPHLRTRVAVNLFKQLLLKQEYVADRPQTLAVFEAFAKLGLEPPLTERTWESWFGNAHIIPKRGKAKVLDNVATSSLTTPTRGGATHQRVPGQFFTDLIHGGLISALTKRTKTKNLAGEIHERARRYEPASELHLHLDAIEVCGLTRSFQAMPWQEFKAIAANRILECLTRRWCPRHGTVYATLSSDLWLDWRDASEDRREDIRSSFARITPNLFQRELDRAPKPDWIKTAVDSDLCETHIYKALFAIAADDKFLVADRLTTWTIDLATAALAMHSLAWTDRYNTLGHKVTNELLYWKAFDTVLFQEDVREIDEFHLAPAMARSTAKWNSAALDVFKSANRTYRDVLADLGVSIRAIEAAAMRASTTHEIKYIG